MNDYTTKRCSKCRQVKPLSEFHKNKARSDGFNNDCKQCRSKAKPDMSPPIPDGYKRCTKCSKEFPHTPEYFSRNKGKLASQCKKCSKEYQQQYRDKDREKYNATIKNQRQERREAYNAQQREYRSKNLERIRERERQYHARNPHIKFMKNRRYRAKHKDVRIVQHQRRRALKLALPDTFTAQDWLRCLEYFHNTCAVCGGQLRDLFGKVEPNADHWHPLNQPGCPGTVADNMICLCSTCNSSKNDRIPEDWLVNRYGKRKANQILKRVRDYFEWLKQR